MRLLFLLLVVALSPVRAAEMVPSRPGVGSPQLAYAGPFSVGVKSLHVEARRAGKLAAAVSLQRAATADRALRLSVWYPATPGGRPTTYAASLTAEPPRSPARFHIPAMAVANAPADGGRYPVVLVSHGYNNDPSMLSWLTENLASKGYVVVAIAHEDPPITDRGQIPAALLRRPLDIAQVLRALRSGLLGSMADISRIALVGYSMGGYGVLVSAGARLDPASPILGQLPTELVSGYAGGGTAGELLGGELKAVIAIAPAGGAPWSVFGDGMAGIRTPLLIVAGDADRRVGYAQGPAALFGAAINTDRYLLVFHGAGHALGVNPAPAEMRGQLWDLDWFEDPIWRKDRLNAISLHFVTAFLDLHVKGDLSRAAYLQTSTQESGEAEWKGPDSPYDGVSDGTLNPAWKGFPRDHQDGLLLRHLDAGGPR